MSNCSFGQFWVFEVAHDDVDPTIDGLFPITGKSPDGLNQCSGAWFDLSITHDDPYLRKNLLS
jgi:hypothetical protein